MDVNYILIKGNKHFKCHSLAEMAIYFSLSVTSFLMIMLCWSLPL